MIIRLYLVMINMRLTIFISLLILSLGCSNTKNVTTTNKFNGTWMPVKQEIGGTALPDEALKNQKLIILDNTYTVIADNIDKGIVKYQGNKMDIYSNEGANKGKHFTAIFKYETGLLTICYNLKGDSYPEVFETKGKPLFFLSVFKKAK